jgi:hypothetical protein
MPLTDKLKNDPNWGNPNAAQHQHEIDYGDRPKDTAPPTVVTPTQTAAPPPAATAAPQDNSPGGYLHWLATASPMANWQRSFEDRFTRGGLDYLFSQLPSPAKTQSGLSTPDFLAQERAKTQAAKAALGPVGQATADVAGYGMSAPLFQAAGVNNPIVQGAISGGINAVGHGGGVKDVATQSAEEGAAGALSIPLSKYVVNPLIKAVRNNPVGPFGSGPPSSVVYPYVKPGQTAQGGQPAQSPTLGGVPGFRDPRYPASMSAQDLANMARDMEGMPPATGEGGEAQNALMQIMKQRLNDVVTQGTPTGGAPGSGQAAANEAYWAAGGPPNAPGGADSLTPLQRGVARVTGGAAGGALGHMFDIPGAREGGAFMGAQMAPEALAWALNRTPSGGAYPAFSVRPPTAQQAAANLLVGGSPDYAQWLQQQGLGQ